MLDKLVSSFLGCSTRQRVMLALLCALGVWYPLAGFLTAAFARIRGLGTPFFLAPLLGACLSLILFVIGYVAVSLGLV